MMVNISELEKGNGELYMVRGAWKPRYYNGISWVQLISKNLL